MKSFGLCKEMMGYKRRRPSKRFQSRKCYEKASREDQQKAFKVANAMKKQAEYLLRLIFALTGMVYSHTSLRSTVQLITVTVDTHTSLHSSVQKTCYGCIHRLIAYNRTVATTVTVDTRTFFRSTVQLADMLRLYP